MALRRKRGSFRCRKLTLTTAVCAVIHRARHTSEYFSGHTQAENNTHDPTFSCAPVAAVAIADTASNYIELKLMPCRFIAVPGFTFTVEVSG